MNVLPFEKRVHVLSMLVEGNSIRSIERMTGINRNTIMDLQVLVGEACAELHRKMVHNLRSTVIQIDELWTFVQKKEKRVKFGEPADYGDQYTFVAIDASSKLVISTITGKRDSDSAEAFALDLRARVLGKPQISSDGFRPYVEAIDHAFGNDVHYAQVIKEFKTAAASKQAKDRYTPGRVLGVSKWPLSGEPEARHISTSFVERQNLSLRMGNRRFTRLTNAFSKKLRNLKASIALWYGYYNLCRVHESLGTTPAVAAGLTAEPWSVADLLATALDVRKAA